MGCCIAASTGTDLAVVVAEPSLFGAYDLGRALDLLDHFEIPAHVCVNRADLAPERAEAICELASARGLQPGIQIPYDEAVLRAVRAGQPIGALDETLAAAAIDRLWAQVEGASEGLDQRTRTKSTSPS